MTRRWVILSIPGRSTMKDKRSVKIGILAEDQTDCKTIEVLVGRLLSASGKSASFSHRGKDGCANLRRKAKAWMGELTDVGCAALILIHDLDRNPSNHTLNDEAELRGRLAQIPVPRGVAHHICIPVEEVGAWFWSCPTALERVAPGQGNSRAKPSPHLLPKPKEALIKLSAAQHGGKARYTTGQNPELAALLDLELCASRCPSFRDLRSFVVDSVASAA
jgi:hypothetical protein